MKEWRIAWTQCPTDYNTPHVLFIEAATAQDARELARQYVERQYGIDAGYVDFGRPVETTPAPAGRVVGAS